MKIWRGLAALLGVAMLLAGCSPARDQESGTDANPALRLVDGAQYPYAVQVWAGGDTPGCSAAALSGSWVLTAAHCMYNSRTTKPFPLSSYEIQTANGQKSKVAQRIVHPKYSHPKGSNEWAVTAGPNDLVLLKLKTKLSLTPLRFAAKNPQPGTNVTMLGWGCVEQDTSAPIFVCLQPNDAKRIKVMPTHLSASGDCARLPDASNLCAQRYDKARMPLQHDSGGAVIIGTGSDARLVGLMSALGNTPSVLLAGLDRQWITQVTGVKPA